MLKLLVIAVLILIQPCLGAAERTESYSSVAYQSSGQVAYREKHTARFVDSKVQSARTEYLDPSGKIFAEMNSDFSKSTTLPSYDFTDLRDGASHGIRLDQDDIFLWKQEKMGKKEETKFSKDDFPSDTLLVGCQGMHYYLVENLTTLSVDDQKKVKYFIPGKLDFFSFTLKFMNEDKDFAFLDLSVNSFFLKLFTSTLKLKYRKADRRLVEYNGLSNVSVTNDKIENVKIVYSYE